MNSKFYAFSMIFLIALLMGCTSTTDANEGGEFASQVTNQPIGEPVGRDTASAPKKTVRLTLTQFEFTPSIINVDEGDLVTLIVTSEDVTHGVGVQEFGISKVVEPGKTVEIEFLADQAGEFNMFCSVFCGSGHRDMQATLVVKAKE